MKQLSFFDSPLTVTTTSVKKSIAILNGNGFADDAVRGFDKNKRLTGLTNGKFSLISLIVSLLKITGKSNIIVSTWSAGLYDAGIIKQLIDSENIHSFKLIIDRSFKTRQKKYTTYFTDIFDPKNIRTTNTHSKFVLIWNDEWNICIRSSMNLNENKRCENFDIDNDTDVFNLFKKFSDDIFEKQPEGIIENRKIVDPVFDAIFSEGNDNTGKGEALLDYNSFKFDE